MVCSSFSFSLGLALTKRQVCVYGRYVALKAKYTYPVKTEVCYIVLVHVKCLEDAKTMGTFL